MSNLDNLKSKEKIDEKKITTEELAKKVQEINDKLNKLIELIKTRNF